MTEKDQKVFSWKRRSAIGKRCLANWTHAHMQTELVLSDK